MMVPAFLSTNIRSHPVSGFHSPKCILLHPSPCPKIEQYTLCVLKPRQQSPATTEFVTGPCLVLAGGFRLKIIAHLIRAVAVNRRHTLRRRPCHTARESESMRQQTLVAKKCGLMIPPSTQAGYREYVALG